MPDMVSVALPLSIPFVPATHRRGSNLVGFWYQRLCQMRLALCAVRKSNVRAGREKGNSLIESFSSFFDPHSRWSGRFLVSDLVSVVLPLSIPFVPATHRRVSNLVGFWYQRLCQSRFRARRRRSIGYPT